MREREREEREKEGERACRPEGGGKRGCNVQPKFKMSILDLLAERKSGSGKYWGRGATEGDLGRQGVGWVGPGRGK